MIERNVAEGVKTSRAAASEPDAALVRAATDVSPIVLSTELVTTLEGVRALKPDYERLYQVTRNTLPFALQEWHLIWCKHFLNTKAHPRQKLLFFVLRNRSGECSAIVPLIFSRWDVYPLRLATIDIIGSDPALTEIRGPLIEPGYEGPTVRAVHGRLAILPEWDWIQWRGVTGELAEALTAEVDPLWHTVSEDFVLDLPSTWDEFRAALKRNVRESLRHCYNSLRRDGHRFEFLVAREPAEVRNALPRFLELHALRARMRQGARHPDHFATRALQRFLYDICESLAARDAVRVFQLRIGTEIVASRIAFAVADSLYLFYSGFDPAWARFSVMTTTVAESFKYAIEHGYRSVNLSLTSEQSKLRWRPRRIEFHSAFVHRRTLSSRMACRAYRATMMGTAAMWNDGVTLRILKSLLVSRRG